MGLGVTLLLLCGCAAMTDVKPTGVPLEANDMAAGRDIESAATSPWPDEAWWQHYGDPQLDRLVAEAVAGSPKMATAKARLAVARDLARVSNAALQPSVQGGADFDSSHFSHDYYIPDDINGHYLFSEVWNNSAGLTGTYSLDLWGRDRAALEAALDAVKVGEYEAQSARLTLEGAVVRTYADLAYGYEIQDHETAILATESQTLDLAMRRLKAGIGTELEIQQANNAVAATRAQLEEIANRLLLSQHQLAALCGKGPGSGEQISRPMLTLTLQSGLPSRIPAELIGRRPDVQAERWRVEGAAKQIAVAKAAFYPNIDLKATVGLVGIGFGDFLSARAIDSSVGPAITLPIFEGGQLRAGLDLRTSQYDLAVDAYDAAVIDALREVADLISRLNSLETLRARREDSLSYARRAHELALIAFRAGLTDYNNVLSTEDALNRAQNLIADTGFQQITASAALNQALGGGLPAAPLHADIAVPR